jgi:hypothetical protein
MVATENNASDDAQEFTNLWAIHSESDNQPMFRDWAKSEDEANKRLAEIKAEDGDDADDEYWVMRMVKTEVESMKEAGILPPEA